MATAFSTHTTHTHRLSDYNYPITKRLRVHSSDEDSYDGPRDLLNEIGAHTFEENRVGVPPLLLLPLDSISILDSDIHRAYVYDEELQQDIKKILKKYEIEIKFMDLEHRHVARVPDSATVETLCIKISKRCIFKAANYRNCAAEIFNLLQASKTMQSRSPKVVTRVEMLGHPLWAEKCISHVETHHPFLTAWEKDLRQKFTAWLKVKTALHGKIRSIDVVRLGFNLRDPSSNPIVVSITTDWTIDPPDYKSSKFGMLQDLEKANFKDVLVEFERGEVYLGNGDDVEELKPPPFKLLSAKQVALPDIRPGSSLSNGTVDNPEPHARALGTVGVVLEIVNVKTQNVHSTIVLTNHHVVRTGLSGFVIPEKDDKTQKKTIWSPAEKNSICARLDQEGYWEPKESAGMGEDLLPHLFRSPSFRAIQDTIKFHKSKMTKIKDTTAKLAPELRQLAQKDIDASQDIVTKLEDPKYSMQPMGGIYYSGGLHRKSSYYGRLDLAGIKIVGETLKRATNDISHRFEEWTADKPYAPKIQGINHDFGVDLKTGNIQDVFKIGAATGCTQGTISPRKTSKVELPWDDEGDWTYDITVVGTAGTSNVVEPFSWKGDSGAPVFDIGGIWLGVVYAGQTKLNTKSPLSYIIPATSILKDIEEISNGIYEARLKA